MTGKLEDHPHGDNQWLREITENNPTQEKEGKEEEKEEKEKEEKEKDETEEKEEENVSDLAEPKL